MTIVITDGRTLNPGDLDWSPMNEIGSVRYYDHTPQEMLEQHCAGAEVIITNKTVIPKEFIHTSRELRMIAVSATGYNNVAIDAAKEKNVLVCNVPEYGTWSVAQHTFALLLELTNHTGKNIESTKKDEWANELWSYTRQPITELKQKVFGIVGYGRIGKQVHAIASAFGMRVIFNNRSEVKNADAEQVSLEDLFSRSDVVSLHCPLTAENTGFVNETLLSKMKKTALLINTSRGALINEKDLEHALNKQMLKGAALDVLTQEPPLPNHPLIHHPLCIVTPHNAWISVEARSRLLATTIENIKSFMSGDPRNVVNGQ